MTDDLGIAVEIIAPTMRLRWVTVLTPLPRLSELKTRPATLHGLRLKQIPHRDWCRFGMTRGFIAWRDCFLSRKETLISLNAGREQQVCDLLM